MLYNGVFGCHGNTCYVIFIGAIFYMLYSIGPINVCTDFEINRYKIDEVRKYAKIDRVLFDLFDVMWRKNVTSCVMGTPTVLIDILTRNILKPTRSLYDFRFRSYGSHSGFRVFGDLDLDLWPMFFFCHTHCAWCTGISMRSFSRIRPVWMGDMLRLKFW